MIRLNLTEDELQKLKTVSDYLFFDQYKDSATFPQFERSFAFFFHKRKISLEKIFKEICGPKRKYITFPRMLKAFLLYKNFPGKVSIDLKNFFGHIFKNVLKKPGEAIGPSTLKSKKYTTANCKHKEGITRLLVLCDKNENIKGLKLEYDDAFKSKMYDSVANKVLFVKLEMLFGLLDDAENDKNICQNLLAKTEPLYRDNITHVFGTYTNKIEFLGFKCRSGKVGFVGKPKGDAFLFGNYGEQFHYVKTQTVNCITQMIPFFKESPRANSFLKLKLNEITEDLILNEPLVADERHLAMLSDPKVIEKFVTNPLVRDDMFFKPVNDYEILGNDFNEVVDREPRKWQLDEHVNQVKADGTLMSLNEILGPAGDRPLKGGRRRNKPKKKDKEEKGKSKGKDRDGDFKSKSKPHKSKSKGKNFFFKSKPKRRPHKDEDHHKPKFIVTRSNNPRKNHFNRRPEPQWDGVSAKNLKSRHILRNKDNYKKLLDRIDGEIKTELRKEKGKQLSEKKDNFYEKYLSRHKDFVPSKSHSPRRVKNVRKMEKRFDDIKQKGKKKEVLKSRARNPKRGGVAAAISYQSNSQQPRLRSTNLRGQPMNFKSNRRGFFDNIFYDDPFGGSMWDDDDQYVYIYEKPSGKSKYTYYDDDDDDDDYYGGRTNKKTSYYDQYDDSGYNKKKNYYDNDYDSGYNKRNYYYEEEKPQQKEEEPEVEEQMEEEEEVEEKYDPYEETRKKNDDYYNNNRSIFDYFNKPIKEDPEKVKKAQESWKKISEKLEKNQGIHILETMGAVIRAIHVLQKAEDDEVSNVSLREKIKLYTILEDNQNIVDFLSQVPAEDEEEEQTQPTTGTTLKYDDDDDDDDNQQQDEDENEEDEEDDMEELAAGIEGLDLGEINARITSIEKLFPTVDNEDKKKKLNDLYELCKQRKNQLIEEEEEKAKQELIKETKVDVDDLVKQEEEKRKKKMLEEQDYIKELQKKALEAVTEVKEGEKEAGKKKHHGNNQQVSISSKPTPDRIYKSQQIYKGSAPWTDPLFPPETKSLCPTDEEGNWLLPPDVLEEDVEGWDGFKWCRVQEIFGSEEYQVFHDGILDDDIIQGALGDCYFLSAIAALCKFPKMIEKLFFFKEKSLEHCYGVFLCINGQWELVLIDDYVPCTGRYAKKFAFSSANGNELWVVLLEKAWAKINGSYAKVGCGGLPHEVFDVITEAYNEKFDISPKFADQIWEGLMKGQEQGFIMTAGTSCDTNSLDIEEMGLVPGHAYTILGVYEAGGERLIHIRNPWGSGEWSGDWCDTSDKWTPALRRQVGLQSGDKDDGEFFMSFDDYLKYFCMMGICKLHDDYVYVASKIPKPEVNGPAVTEVTIENNNVHVYFQLWQKNPRIILSDGTYQEPVIAYMLLVDSDFNYIASISKAEMSLCIEQTLKKGTYYLVTDINYRYANNGKILGYNISSYASEEVSLELVTKTVQPGPIIEKAVTQYAKKNLTPSKESGGAVTSYISKAYSKDWPFVIALFENNSKSDVTVQFDVKCRGMKSFAYYNEPTAKETDTSLSKKIPSKQSGVILVMQYSLSSMFSFSYGIDAELDEATLGDTVFSEIPEALDDNETILQYVHEERNGYMIGLENKRKAKLKMKLEIEGLEFSDRNYKGRDVCVFYIDKNERKVFGVTVKKGYSGDISFGFNFA